MKIENESGVFTIDDTGRLIEYLPKESNTVDKETHVYRHLIFPDEIRIIPEIVNNFIFRGITIVESLVFPANLIELGSFEPKSVGIFSRSKLPDIVLPETLRVLGNFAFGKSEIRSIDLHEYTYQYGRQFKGAHIGTWYLSKNAPKDPYTLGSLRFNDQVYDSIIEY